jgi:Skp family chaperone for outer membrane proteins
MLEMATRFLSCQAAKRPAPFYTDETAVSAKWFGYYSAIPSNPGRLTKKLTTTRSRQSGKIGLDASLRHAVQWAAGRQKTGESTMRLKAMVAGAALAIVVLSVSWSSGWQEAAPEPAPSNARDRTALVDLTRVYAEHAGFKQKVERMKLVVQLAEKELAARKNELEEAKGLLQKMPAGSEKREAQEKYDDDSAQLQRSVNRQKQQFMEQEARLYAETYDQVLAIIAAYAERERIELVLRFNGSQDGFRDDLTKTMQHLNRQVLYHKDIDITDEIIRRVNAE